MANHGITLTTQISNKTTDGYATPELLLDIIDEEFIAETYEWKNEACIEYIDSEFNKSFGICDVKKIVTNKLIKLEFECNDTQNELIVGSSQEILVFNSKDKASFIKASEIVPGEWLCDKEKNKNAFVTNVSNVTETTELYQITARDGEDKIALVLQTDLVIKI